MGGVLRQGSNVEKRETRFQIANRGRGLVLMVIVGTRVSDIDHIFQIFFRKISLNKL